MLTSTSGNISLKLKWVTVVDNDRLRTTRIEHHSHVVISEVDSLNNYDILLGHGGIRPV